MLFVVYCDEDAGRYAGATFATVCFPSWICEGVKDTYRVPSFTVKASARTADRGDRRTSTNLPHS